MADSPSNPRAGTNYIVSGIVALITSGAIAITANAMLFSGLTSGTNTTAAMVVGTGASLAASGSGTITATAAPISGVTGLGTGVGTWLATPSSANLATALTDETGSGACVFGTSPTINADVVSATIQHLTLNAQSGAGYTLVLADDYKLVTLSNAGAQALSIPTNASVAFPVGTQIIVISIGAGQWTIQATNSGTTTVLSNGGTAAAPKLRVQYSSATLIKVATDTWYVVGDIS